MDKKRVAIVIPLSTRPGFSDSEKLSLKHLEHFLGVYDKYFLAPEQLAVDYDNIPVERFQDKYFGSLDAHTRLSLSKEFYRRFSNYEYMLMYHLDCLVFDSNLDAWCDMEYDLIGPPWIKGPDLPWLKEEGVGNTGFSLRKISSFLKLLNSNAYWIDPSDENHFGKAASFSQSLRNELRKLYYRFKPGNNIQSHLEHHIVEKGGHDDIFIFKFAQKYYPDFSIAPVEVALQFGFEANPRKCYELNGKKLPFGCHAWEKFDKEFWERYIID